MQGELNWRNVRVCVYILCDSRISALYIKQNGFESDEILDASLLYSDIGGHAYAKSELFELIRVTWEITWKRNV